MRRDFHPDQIAVHSTQAQQIVGDCALGKETAEKCLPRGRIHEPFGRERRHAFVGGAGCVAQHRFEDAG